MILSSHIIIGGALGTRSKNIFWAFIFGFFSHYILDFIPHWEYVCELENIFIPINVLKIFIDLMIGLLIVLLIIRFSKNKLFILVGAGASILPDILQVVIFYLRLDCLEYLSIFHNIVHANMDLSLLPGLLVMFLIFIAGILIIKL
ncbi:hypothetical protein ACFLZ0_01350 [Patescibacteria group bacterium]